MTEPEQWAERLWFRACASQNPALTIQRAFENQKLREDLDMIPANIVLDTLHTFASMEPEEDETWESWFHAAFDMAAERIGRRARGILTTRQALATRQPTPTEGSSDDQ